MSVVTNEELDQLCGELLPERAVMSTITFPGASFNQSSQSGGYSVGPNGVSYSFQSAAVSSQLGNSNSGLLTGLLGGLGL